MRMLVTHVIHRPDNGGYFAIVHDAATEETLHTTGIEKERSDAALLADCWIGNLGRHTT